MTMFVCSMDHSPSEQIVDPTAWHTTVVILSEAASQWSLSKRLAAEIGLQGNRLKKWSRYSDKQKSKFLECAEQLLVDSDLHIAAISAQAQTIEDAFDRLVREFGISKIVRSVTRRGKAYVEIGPLIKVDGRTGEQAKVRLQLIKQRATMLLFVLNFLIGTHAELLKRLQQHDPNVQWLDFQVTADKLPGGLDGEMHRAFEALVSILCHPPQLAGNFRISTFLAEDPGSDVADNYAGMLRQTLLSGEALPSSFPLAAELQPASLCWRVVTPA